MSGGIISHIMYLNPIRLCNMSHHFFKHLSITLLLLTAFSCTAEFEDSKCIAAIIDNKNKDFDCWSFELYKFQGDYVYLNNISNCCCDGSSTIYNTECETIGQIGGWLSYEVNGVNFYENSELIRTIWPE